MPNKIDTLPKSSQVVFCVTLNHRTAPVEIRECLATTPTESTNMLQQLMGSSAESPILEAVLLSTCNRLEVYAVASDCDQAVTYLSQILARTKNTPLETFFAHWVCAQGSAAVRHLCAVASGLDSMILGEPQILGQVAEAYGVAQVCGATGPVLAALFRKALETGKKARTETAIGAHAVSVSYAAVELAKQIFGSLKDRYVLLIGAGEMAELAARNLLDSVGQILVVNRSYDRAEKLAQDFGGSAYRWDDLRIALARADIVIGSAGAPQAIISREMVREAMVLRRQKPLFLIDIAVPRNVDARAADLPSVYLYNIDDLQTVVQKNLAQRACEVPKVEAIVDQARDEFMDWLRSLEVVPTIRDLRSMAERICDDEVGRALRRLGSPSERDTQIVRGLATGIVNRLLHSPTVRLKEHAQQGRGFQYADSLRDLFGLAPNSNGDDGHD